MHLTISVTEQSASRPLSLRCRVCDRIFSGVVRGTPGALARCALQLWPERCPHCGDMAGYSRDEYFFS